MITRQQIEKHTGKANGKENRKPVAGRKASNTDPPAKEPVVKKVRNTTIITRMQKRQQEQQQRRSPRVSSWNAASVESHLESVPPPTSNSIQEVVAVTDNLRTDAYTAAWTLNFLTDPSTVLRRIVSIRCYHAAMNAKLDRLLKGMMEEKWTPNTTGSRPCTCLYDILELKRLLVLLKAELDELEELLNRNRNRILSLI